MHPEVELNLRRTLASEAAARLVGVDPEHELLRYLPYTEGSQMQREFLQRFGIPGTTLLERKANRGLIYAYAQYERALCEACVDPKKKIVVRHIPIRAWQFFCHMSWRLANGLLIGAAVATAAHIYGSEEPFPIWALGLLGSAVLFRRLGNALYYRAY